MKSVRSLFGALIVGTVCACTAPRTPQASWHDLVTEYVEAYLREHPAFAAAQGRHEYDGRLPDWSEAGIRAEASRIARFRERVQRFPTDRLSPAERFEREYLLTRIDRELFWTTVADAPFRNPAFYLGMSDGGDSLDPATYVVKPYAPVDTRARAFIAYARDVVRVAPEIRRNLAHPMPATYLKLGIAGFRGLASFYRHDAPLAFAAVQDPSLRQAVADATQPAARALDAIADDLAHRTPTVGFSEALGAERFARLLQMTERVQMPLADIEAALQADLDRNLVALQAACRRYAPTLSSRDCVARMNADKPAEGPVAAARTQLPELKQFILSHDLVTIPGTEDARVEASPPYNQQNGAYIDPPGYFDRDVPAVYYLSPPDPSWTAEEQASYVESRANLLFVSTHEVWPGHFLQFQWSNRAASTVGGLWVGYAFAEGWGHYAEEMMWEAGLGQGDPETHIGQLVNALERNVRAIVALGLHTHGMSVETAEQLFVDKAYADRGEARQQAARGTYDPGYLNYTLGKLMIRKMRDDYCESRGVRACWKDFHDRVLAWGGPPLPLLRQQLLPDDPRPVL
jgi:Bacterial protein of unknown function (DUF885)